VGAVTGMGVGAGAGGCMCVHVCPQVVGVWGRGWRCRQRPAPELHVHQSAAAAAFTSKKVAGTTAGHCSADKPLPRAHALLPTAALCVCVCVCARVCVCVCVCLCAAQPGGVRAHR